MPDRIIHLHPSRRCNLACLHCYSESSPGEKDALASATLIRALGVLRQEGYASISLSGGEPLMYRPLRSLIDASRELGFRIFMVTNGLLYTEASKPVFAGLDSVASSFDGLAPAHNLIRGQPDAFERASATLQKLAGVRPHVSAAISLRREAIPDLPDLADELVRLGATALQIRPVALAGRARSMAGGASYSAADRARLWLVVLALQREPPSTVRISCDLAPTQGLWQQRDAYASLLAPPANLSQGEPPLADLVNPLVITETGAAKPIAYDFDSRFDVASIGTLTSETLQDYRRHDLPAFQGLVRTALEDMQNRHDLVDWFDYCARLSEVHR